MNENTISNLGSHYVLYLQEVPKAGPTESIGFVDSHRDQRRINKQLCKESLRGGKWKVFQISLQINSYGGEEHPTVSNDSGENTATQIKLYSSGKI